MFSRRLRPFPFGLLAFQVGRCRGVNGSYQGPRLSFILGALMRPVLRSTPGLRAPLLLDPNPGLEMALEMPRAKPLGRCCKTALNSLFFSVAPSLAGCLWGPHFHPDELKIRKGRRRGPIFYSHLAETSPLDAMRPKSLVA